MLLLLLLMADLSFTEEHPHRHAHEAATTSAPPARTRRNQQRLQQLQQAQDGNDIVFDIGNNNDNNNAGGNTYNSHHQHHHLRHEQHLRAELAGGNNNNNGNRQPPTVVKQPTQLELEQLAMLPGPGQQHHLRHHNRHHAAWAQRVFRHQQHRSPAAASTTPTTTTVRPESSTSISMSMVTDAPLSHSLGNSSRYFDRDGIYASWMQPRSTLAPNWQQLEDSYEDDDNDEDDDDDDEDYEDDVDVAAAAELAKQMPRYSLFSQKLPTISSNEQDYDAYDQMDLESTSNNNNNKHPSVSSGHAKGASKRNVFDWLFKRDKEKGQMNSQSHAKVDTTTEKPKSFLDDSLADEEDNEDPIAAFSNEQWNKIEHEHHLKQQKHQKELQALREKNRNAPLIRGGLRRGGIDNEDADNNYSRNYIPGKLTDLKNNQLGTAEAVLKTRRKHGPSHAEVNAHWKKVIKESTCRVPQLRCVRVESDTSKQYAPHCIQLHRCAEDSGCCHSRHEICAPKEIHKVELPFHVLGTNSRKSEPVNLTFDNHTECHCIERINYNADVAKLVETELAEVKEDTILNCKCPGLFEKIIQNDGTCRCDCSSSNFHCEFRKRGKEHFFMDERRCINQGVCKPPTCLYGPYIKKEGRCPNQHEQLPYQSSYKSHNMS